MLKTTGLLTVFLCLGLTSVEARSHAHPARHHHAVEHDKPSPVLSAIDETAAAIRKQNRELAEMRDEIASLRTLLTPPNAPPATPRPKELEHQSANIPVPDVPAPMPTPPKKTASLEPDAAVDEPKQADAIDVTRSAATEYLVATACPGYTMERQGVHLAIARLHPMFRARLADAFHDAREHGLKPCIFSAYRPPGFGVGGFRDKFMSAHSYGLAVDLGAIGRPGSSDAKAWRAVAARHDLAMPYSVYSRSEWNHCQATPFTLVTRAAIALRRTITAAGPIDLAAMFKAADALIDRGDAALASEKPRHRPVAEAHRHHHAEHRRRHVAALLENKWPQ